MNARLRIMVDSREIEESEAPDREVVARWRKADGTYRDAGKDLGQDTRLTLYYQAGLQAATALVRAAGFRVLGTDHHRHTFEALHALEAGELSRIAREMNAFRRKRHQAIYDWDDTPDSDAPEGSTAVEELGRNAGRMLELGYGWLVANRPGIGSTLDPPSRA